MNEGIRMLLLSCGIGLLAAAAPEGGWQPEGGGGIPLGMLLVRAAVLLVAGAATYLVLKKLRKK